MNDTVLITGGSRGIGRACAMAMAREGYRIAVVCRSRKEEAESLVQQLRENGTDAEYYLCDAADGDSVRNVVEQVTRRFGRIDVLINNAGIAQIRLFTDLSEEDWNRMMDVNAGGVFHFCHAVAPQMISRKKGSIINVSSMWGIAGASCEVHYSASKAAVIGFTKALARELGPSGIRVNCIAPGVIETEMNAELTEETMDSLRDEIPLGHIGRPEDVAEAAVFLASTRASYITAQVLSVDGGIL